MICLWLPDPLNNSRLNETQNNNNISNKYQTYIGDISTKYQQSIIDISLIYQVRSHSLTCVVYVMNMIWFPIEFIPFESLGKAPSLLTKVKSFLTCADTN